MISTSTLRRSVLSLTVAACLVAAASPAAAGKRARLSADLKERLARGDQDIDIIVDGGRSDVDALARQYNLRVKRYLRSGAVLRVNAGQLSALEGDETLSHVSSDLPVRAGADVTRETIGAVQVGAGAGKIKALTGAGIGIAVIDSGMDLAHPALAKKVVASVDFTGGDGIDRYGHGTHVAALIAGAAGTTADTADYSGIAPRAHLVNLRVLDAKGAGLASYVVDAIDWAIENRKAFNIRVINLSLGAPVLQPAADDPLCKAADRAAAAGIVVVAAAGNYGMNAAGQRVFRSITSPANAASVIAVGALDTKGTAARFDDTVAKFSSLGPTLFDSAIKPDLVAPGRNVVSAEAQGSLLAVEHPERHVAAGYISLSGSSISAGIVSGTVALLADRRPNLRPAEARLLLQATATFMGEGLVVSGAGSLNALAAAQLTGGQRTGSLSTVIAGEVTLPGGLLTLSSSNAFDRGLFSDRLQPSFGRVLGSTIVWGSAAANDTIVWGSAASLDTIVWGSGVTETIVWGSGQQDTIVWGSGALDTIVWGSAASGTIVWGSSLVSGQTIVWGSRSNDTIVWGSGTNDTIVWGSGTNDTIVWGSRVNDTIVWGSGTNDTIVWGS